MNWLAYKLGLRRLGDLTFWLDEAALAGLAGTVPDALFAHTSPSTWEHIGLSGDFL